MNFDYKLRWKAFLIIFLARSVRMFSYGMLSFIFLDNLFLKGFSPKKTSLIQSAVVLGDLIVSLYLATKADRFGRLNILLMASVLKLITGLCYADSQNTTIIILSGFFGIISVTGREIGPFQSIERAALSQLVQDCTYNKIQAQQKSVVVFGSYNMIGYIGQALGAAFAGFFVDYVVNQMNCSLEAASIKLLRIYAILGGVKFLLYSFLNSKQIEPKSSQQNKIWFGGIKKENMKPVLFLSLLYAFDAFTGALAAQSFLSYYYQMRFELNFQQVGMILFGCTLLSGLGGILSSRLTKKYGSAKTILYSVIPSNVFLILIGLFQHPTICTLLLFCRYSTLQMYAPARQALTSKLVSEEQRSAVNGITSVAFSVGLALGMALNGISIIRYTYSRFTTSFILSGLLNILVVYCYFKKCLPQDRSQKFEKVQEQPYEGDGRTIDRL